MMNFLEYGTLFVGPLIWKGDILGDMCMNRQDRRILKFCQINKNFSGLCRATFNLNSVALILARMKHYRKYIHFVDINAKTDMLAILTLFKIGYLPVCPF